MNREQIIVISGASLVLIVATAMLVRVDARRAKNQLVVDSGDAEAEVSIDGVAVGRVPPRSHAVFEVKKGKHDVVAKRSDGKVERVALALTRPYSRALFHLENARPAALVSVAYGTCESYYESGHALHFEGKIIDRPGVIRLPTTPGLVELPPGMYLSIDLPFAATREVKRNECGVLSTNLCHLDAEGQSACAGADGEHTAVKER